MTEKRELRDTGRAHRKIRLGTLYTGVRLVGPDEYAVVAHCMLGGLVAINGRVTERVMAPQEARQLAQELLEAADRAEARAGRRPRTYHLFPEGDGYCRVVVGVLPTPRERKDKWELRAAADDAVCDFHGTRKEAINAALKKM